MYFVTRTFPVFDLDTGKKHVYTGGAGDFGGTGVTLPFVIGSVTPETSAAPE